MSDQGYEQGDERHSMSPRTLLQPTAAVLLR